MPPLTAKEAVAAAWSGDLVTLRAYLDAGGDPNLLGTDDVDGDGQLTLLQLAAQQGHTEAVAALAEHPDCRRNERSLRTGDTALILAVKGGHSAAAQCLILRADIDLDAQNSAGFTALMKAAEQNARSMVLLLLRHGAALELVTTDGRGHTALTLAVANLSVRAVDLLLQFGASLDHRTAAGRTPRDQVWHVSSARTAEEKAARQPLVVEILKDALQYRDYVKRETGLPSDVLNGQYKLSSEILGKGTFGCVLLADNLRCRSRESSRVAVKVLKPRSRRCTAEIHADGVHEAKLMLMVQHPQVVRMLQYFHVDKFFCIVMEFCEFGDADLWITSLNRKHRQLPAETAMHWFLQLLLGLEYLHGLRILHRDLKPRNIFLQRDGTAKMGDFGLSRRLLGDSDLASTVAGTAVYMAPEILQKIRDPGPEVAAVPREGYDTKCDVWSLGCTLYELCTCLQLFDFDRVKQQVCDSSEPPPALPERYPPELNAVLQSMMQRKPKDRASCQQLLETSLVRQQLSLMKNEGCSADLRFLQDNRHLVQRLPDEEDDSADDATLTPEAGPQHLWNAVDSVLQNRPKAELGQLNYDLFDDSISDSVPSSIMEALAEQVRMSGFPLEQVYRRALINFDSPPEVRRAEFARYTDDMKTCERLETLSEMTRE